MGHNQSQPVPLVQENKTIKVSEHVYAIPDGRVNLVPNIGIIVGSRATLIVDAGMGPKNGETVLRELAKVNKNAQLYFTTTHFHPEHVTGGQAFPPNHHRDSTPSATGRSGSKAAGIHWQFQPKNAGNESALAGCEAQAA